jgi:hypothetical protein
MAWEVEIALLREFNEVGELFAKTSMREPKKTVIDILFGAAMEDGRGFHEDLLECSKDILETTK